MRLIFIVLRIILQCHCVSIASIYLYLSRCMHGRTVFPARPLLCIMHVLCIPHFGNIDVKNQYCHESCSRPGNYLSESKIIFSQAFSGNCAIACRFPFDLIQCHICCCSNRSSSSNIKKVDCNNVFLMGLPLLVSTGQLERAIRAAAIDLSSIIKMCLHSCQFLSVVNMRVRLGSCGPSCSRYIC